MKKLCSWFLRLLAWGITSLPQPVQMFIGDLLGWLWFDVIRLRRKVVLSNLALAFPEMPKSERVRIGRASCCNLGRSLVEFTRIPFLKEDSKSRSQFVLKDQHFLDQALHKRRGVCILTLHLGNPDLATVGMAIHGYKLHVISKYFKFKWLNELWFGVREQVGTVFISPRNSSYAILKALKRNAKVVFVNDQFMGPPIGLRSTFFGHETGTALGLAMMASRHRSPVVPIYNYRREDGKIVIQVEPELEFAECTDKNEWMAKVTQKCNDKLQEIIEKHPEQWMWVHRRWKRFKV